MSREGCQSRRILRDCSDVSRGNGAKETTLTKFDGMMGKMKEMASYEREIGMRRQRGHMVAKCIQEKIEAHFLQTMNMSNKSVWEMWLEITYPEAAERA